MKKNSPATPAPLFPSRAGMNNPNAMNNGVNNPNAGGAQGSNFMLQQHNDQQIDQLYVR
jgi:hypothetical protein